MSLEGKPAAGFALPDTTGKTHRLDDYAGRWLLLVFRRHLACLPCREHVTRLYKHRRQLAERGVQVAVVTFERGPIAEAYVRETGLEWPVLLDQDRTLYAAYGIGRGRWWNLAGPATTWSYLKLFFRGRRLRLPTDDVKQLGGDVLIDPQGIVRLHRISRGPSDRPSIEQLLSVVDRR